MSTAEITKLMKGRIYQVLVEHGPKTYAQLAEHLRLPPVAIKACINHDRRNHAPAQNSFRVVDYHRHIGTKGDLSPVVGIGPGPDVPKPVIETRVTDSSRRAREREQVQRAHKDSPEQVTTELAKLRYRQTQEANAGDRAALVFASMFAQPPAPPPKLPSRVYKTRGG